MRVKVSQDLMRVVGLEAGESLSGALDRSWLPGARLFTKPNVNTELMGLERLSTEIQLGTVYRLGFW